MANKRTLKKHFAYVCGELAAECIVSSRLIPGVDVEKMDRTVVRIAMLQDRSMRRVNVDFDKAPRDFENLREYNRERNAYYRAAYRALLDGFQKEVVAIVSDMNAALPKKK